MTQTRRDFLRKAGAGAVAYKLVGAAPRLRAAGPNDQIGFGFIGVGIQGMGLLESFQKIAGVRPIIAADLYDGHLVRAKEVAGSALETTRDYHAVLNRKDVDAVVIATPDHWHRQMVLDALAVGKDVYIEKPLAWSIEQGKELVAVSARHPKQIVQVGSQGKTSAITAKARELIKAGAIGKPNMVRMVNNRNSPEGAWQYPVPPDASPETIDWKRFLGPAPKRPFDANVFFRWRCWWEYSGGVATDLFVHLLTTLHEIMDVTAPRSVVSQGGLYKWNDGRTVPDVLNSIFEYEGWVADMYVNLANSRPPHGTVISGAQGTMVLGGGGRRGQQLIVYPEPAYPRAQRYGTRALPAAVQKELFEAAGFTANGEPKEPPPPVVEKEHPVERGPSHYEYFVMSVRDRTPSREDAAAGHYAAAGAHLANFAYRKGERLQWDWKTGRVS